MHDVEVLPPQGGPRTWVHRVFFSCLFPIPLECHRRLVPQNFSIVDGYVVEATTTGPHALMAHMDRGEVQQPTWAGRTSPPRPMRPKQVKKGPKRLGVPWGLICLKRIYNF